MRVGVLVSGSGTNLQALLDAQAQGHLVPATIAIVISNRPGVQALARANAAGIPTVVVDHKQFQDRRVFEQKLIEELEAANAELVVLAGFMRVLTDQFITRYPERIINTHPSLLPAFPGADAPAQAIAHGVKVSGATIHFVDTSVDGGPIIAQSAVPVLVDDDAATLHARIQTREHLMLPLVVRRLAAGLLSCKGRVVVERAE
ncbi:MAG TPA: phosphoribosylglycinamide formyltransferase [Kofleriaceae bacterium]|jgi:phosphoribosylglycinamide formyltransferase-1|nr:phosphoribosylglycinamide formyltransferase [Kofleriaceae bacterium]